MSIENNYYKSGVPMYASYDYINIIDHIDSTDPKIVMKSHTTDNLTKEIGLTKFEHQSISTAPLGHPVQKDIADVDNPASSTYTKAEPHISEKELVSILSKIKKGSIESCIPLGDLSIQNPVNAYCYGYDNTTKEEITKPFSPHIGPGFVIPEDVIKSIVKVLNRCNSSIENDALSRDIEIAIHNIKSYTSADFYNSI